MGRLAGFTCRQVTLRLRRLGFEFDRQARETTRFGGTLIPDSEPLFLITREIYRKELYRRF